MPCRLVASWRYSHRRSCKYALTDPFAAISQPPLSVVELDHNQRDFQQFYFEQRIWTTTDVQCPLLALSGHSATEVESPLLGVKRTLGHPANKSLRLVIIDQRNAHRPATEAEIASKRLLHFVDVGVFHSRHFAQLLFWSRSAPFRTLAHDFQARAGIEIGKLSSPFSSSPKILRARNPRV